MTTCKYCGNAESNHRMIGGHDFQPTPTVYGACGVEGCTDCRPLYDEQNREIPGTLDGPPERAPWTDATPSEVRAIVEAHRSGDPSS